jgi:hypothetical protein
VDLSRSHTPGLPGMTLTWGDDDGSVNILAKEDNQALHAFSDRPQTFAGPNSP